MEELNLLQQQKSSTTTTTGKNDDNDETKSLLLNKFQTKTCGIHVRFGDDFLDPGKKEPNKRLKQKAPQCYDLGKQKECFIQVANWIDSVCPPLEDDETIFLATDYPKFRQYMLLKQQPK